LTVDFPTLRHVKAALSTAISSAALVYGVAAALLFVAAHSGRNVRA
jgi:hypothetical protein